MSNDKVRSFAALAEELAAERELGRRIALVHGSFDGSEDVDAKLFEALRGLADLVVATVISDRAHHARGESAVFTEHERLARAALIDDADLVATVPWASAKEVIDELRPQVYGVQTAQKLSATPSPEELDALERVGAELFALHRHGRTVSERRIHVQSRTLGRSFVIEQIVARRSPEDILRDVDALRERRVLVVGETIIDEYAYCSALGKSGKEPMLVTRFQSCEAQAGGVLAIANHLADFCGHVELVSALGAVESREEFVRSALRPEIRAQFSYTESAPTIVKRRYIEAYSLAKMFGVYHIDDTPLAGDEEDAFYTLLDGALDRCDTVVVGDYGHGLLTPRVVTLLSKKARFLALNTQLNAANAGYHTLSKYPRADYACLHEGELRMDARDLRSELRGLMELTANGFGARALMVTLGKRGTLLYQRNAGFFACPALASTVIERVGAGDAVLALSSVAVAAGLAPELVGILANLAGAQAVAVIGNSAHVSKARLLESLRSLMASNANHGGEPLE